LLQGDACGWQIVLAVGPEQKRCKIRLLFMANRTLTFSQCHILSPLQGIR
jgi:hypothetical protein